MQRSKLHSHKKQQLNLCHSLLSLLIVFHLRPISSATAAPRSVIHAPQAPAGQPQRRSSVSVTAVAASSSAAAGGSKMSCSAAAAAAPAGDTKAGPQEVPTGMDAEALLIEQLTSIPQISKAICRPSRNTGGKGVDIQVCCMTDFKLGLQQLN
jgi:hypothetical protein